MIDRDVDKISPFYLNQTYEGLLDEFFGINTTCVKVSNEIVYADQKQRKEVEDKRIELELEDVENTFFHLSSSKEILIRKNNTKSMHYLKVENVQNTEIKKIKAYDKDKSFLNGLSKLEAETKVKEIDQTKLKVTEHANMISKLGEFLGNKDYQELLQIEANCNKGEPDDLKIICKILEAKMFKKYDKVEILRTMCLYSCTQNGFNPNDFDHLRKVFILNYGYPELVTLMNLEECGLLKKK